MKLVFKKSFAKDLKQIQDKSLLNRLREVIQEIEAATGIQDLPGIKKITVSGWGTTD